MNSLLQDLRDALRQFRKSPGFSVVAVLTLALGIGANTGIFSLVNAVLLRPLPYKDADRLISIWGENKPKGYDLDLVSSLDYADWKSQNHSFESMGAATDAMYALTGSGEAASIIGYQFSPDFFHVLCVAPMLGRTFAKDEDLPGKNQVVVLSYGLWASRFGADRTVIGKNILLDGKPYSVVGVMPASFQYPTGTQLWTPLTNVPDYAKDRGIRWLRVMARLKSGVTRQQAETEMKTIAARLQQAYPSTNKDQGVNLLTLRQIISGDARPALLVLLCSVGMVLLIACSNLANLLLSRAIIRRREIAVRAALGASRWRIVRQLLCESIFLSLAGGAFGIAMAYWAANFLVGIFPATISNLSIPKIDSIPMDGQVLGFTLLSSILTGVLFGLAPAVLANDPSSHAALKESSRGGATSTTGKRFRNVVVVFQMAVALMLLIAAGLMTRSLLHLITADVGFRSDRVLTFRTMLPGYKYAKEWQRIAFQDEALVKLRNLPGVMHVGTVTFLPLSGWWGTREVSVAGAPSEAGHTNPRPVWSSVSPDYFRTINIPLLKGRTFSDSDNGTTTGVTILSAGLARTLWPDQDPIGRLINIEGFAKPKEVVGVVGDVHQLGLAHPGENSDPTSEVYVPYAQAPAPVLGFVVRTAGDPLKVASQVRRELSAVDKDQPIAFVETMDQLAADSIALPRASMMLVTVFAGMALVLAGMGIYGVLSYSANLRTKEIGVRIALGARPRDVVGMVIGEGALLTAIGFAFGVVGAFSFARLLSSLLFGVKPVDPLIYAVVPLLLACVAMTACYIPARRAARVDPNVALRYE